MLACLPALLEPRLKLAFASRDDEDANVGLVLDSVPQLSAAVEPLRSAAEGATMRSTVSGLQ